jgi:hypothetical protein
LLAAAWPRETLQRMAHEPLWPIATERLCASLMHRRDILAELNGLIIGSSTLMRAALRDLTYDSRAGEDTGCEERSRGSRTRRVLDAVVQALQGNMA